MRQIAFITALLLAGLLAACARGDQGQANSDTVHGAYVGGAIGGGF